MKLIDLLDKHKHSNLLDGYEDGIKHHSKPKKANKRKCERFTSKELDDLMNVHQQTYKRVNGRVRGK